LRQAASRPSPRTFGLFMINPAMFSQSVWPRLPNADLRVHGVALCGRANIPRLHSQFPRGLSLPRRRSVSKYESEVVAGPAGPLSCTSMRLQKQVCSSCPPYSSHQEQVVAALAWPVVARSRPARSLVGSSAGCSFRAVAHQYQASASCLPVRPNPSVKGTSRKRAAPYVER